MAISTYKVRQEYTGNGALTAYTFDFRIASLSHILVRVTNASYVKTFEVRGTDITYLTSVTFDAINGGGTVNLTSVLPNGHKLTILLANDQPLQASEFKDKRDFTLKRFEDALDVIGGAVQRLAYLTKRSLRVSDSLVDSQLANFDTRIPITQTGATDGGKILAVSNDGLGLQLGPTSDQIFTASNAAVGSAAAALVSEGIASAAAVTATAQALIATNANVNLEAIRVEVEQNAAFASTDATTASDAAISAQSSQDACFGYSINAQFSKETAEAAAAAAAVSESNASSDASAAAGAAGSASTDAGAAAISAGSANTAAGNALASENAAALSEINAGLAEIAAQGYATNAQGYSNSALNYKNDALSSKNAAALSETNAAASALAANGDAASALSSKNAAALSETNAAASALAADASADAAAISEANALINSVTGSYDRINLNAAVANPAYAEGRVFYDQVEKCLSYYNEVSGITVNLGQETLIRVINNTGSSIANGKVVYVISAGTNLPQIALAKADAAVTSEGVIGILTATIADGGIGYCTVLGLVHDINTNTFTEGDILYLSPSTAGDFTNVRPTDTNYVVRIGVVLKKDPTLGDVLVFPNQLGQAVRQVVDGGTGGSTTTTARQSLGSQVVSNGLEDNTLFTPTYDPVTRIFSVTYGVGAAFTVQGVRYAKSGSESTTAHAATTGMWFCYYNAAGVLTVSSATWDGSITAFLISAYYNATTPTLSIAYNEKHPGISGFPDSVHRYLHLTQGTKLVSGCAISGYTLNNSAGAIFATSAGILADEDLQVTATATLVGTAKRVFYKIGAAASPRWDYADDVNGFLDNGTNVYYNENSGGTWQLTPITVNNRWVNYYVVASTTQSAPQIWTVMGTVLHTSSASAIAGTFSTDVSDFGLLSQEGVILYKITVRRGSFGAPGNAQYDGVTAITQSLTGVSAGGAINASTIAVDNSGFVGTLGSSETNVQLALNKLDTLVNGLHLLKSVTTTYTQEEVYNWFNCSAAADYTVTLLTAAGKTGQEFVWRAVSNGGFIVTLTPAGAETIDGLTFVTLQNQYDSIKLVSDGTNWMRK